MQRKPAVVSFLTCDHVVRDATTNRISLINLIHELYAFSFPVFHPHLEVYACLTDAQGDYVFELSLLDASTDQPIGAGKSPPLKIPTPLAIVDLDMKLGTVQFPKEGKYEFRLTANGEFLQRKEFAVRKVQPRPVPPASPPEAR
ncbi:MAG TPA: hypothetical protein VKF62_01675 [Planctomycetota bacterium]|nr:hypothetical protein [Planctomycetota bacterium]